MPHRRPLLAAGIAALAAPRLAHAQPAWPNGPIRFIAPFPPGGSVDTITRLLQPALQEALGVPIVVENRAGASGALGTAACARAAPDGQTFVTVFDTHAVNPFLIPNLGFDTRRDLAPVMLLATAPMLVTTPQNKPWKTFEDVVAEAKRRPDTLTYGTIGNGSLAHLTMSLAQEAGGFRVVHVPYRGGGPLTVAAVAGEIDLPMSTQAGLGQQIGRAVRPLVQTGATRSPSFPDVPTLAEAGIAGVSASAFWGVLAPSAVPAPVIARMHDALAGALRRPELRRHLVETQGVDIVASSPAEFGQFLERQMDQWGRVVREKNIRSD